MMVSVRKTLDSFGQARVPCRPRADMSFVTSRLQARQVREGFLLCRHLLELRESSAQAACSATSAESTR